MPILRAKEIYDCFLCDSSAELQKPRFQQNSPQLTNVSKSNSESVAGQEMEKNILICKNPLF